MKFLFEIIFLWSILFSLQNAWSSGSSSQVLSIRDMQESISEDHMCYVTKRVAIHFEKKYNYTYLEPYRTPCTRFPFICTNYRTKVRPETKMVTEFVNMTSLDCCEGYKKDQEVCKPICNNTCGHGKCIAPDVCFCTKGWQGTNCTKECDEGRYGENCVYECVCKNGATCNKINGTCECSPGFTGEYCESPCPKDSYGKNCENSCKCKNGANCDSTNGSCECLPGYYGKQCVSKCVEGTFGKDCKDTCKCKMENTNICSHVDGRCLCKSGWRGDNCEKLCGDQTWGPSCLFPCDCGQNGSCHRITGECSCLPGWYGPKCYQKCPVGYFEQDCKMKCPDCRHEPGTCHHETGWCNCPPGSTGPTCDLECPDGTFGKNCEKLCLCANNSTCDSATGECLCLPGWIGDECQFPCTEGTYGENCNFSCNCPNRISCNRFDGNCNCDATDDDPLCVEGPFYHLYQESFTTYNTNNTTAILVILCIVFIVLLLIGLGIFLLKRKMVKLEKTFSFSNILNFLIRKNVTLPILSNGDNNTLPNPKHFDNPVYEVMNNGSDPKPCAHSFSNPLSVEHEKLDLDFKIPDCDLNTKDKKKDIHLRNTAQIEKITIEETVAKYQKKDENTMDSKNSCQNSPIYAEVDLTEHHFEFSSHRLN